MTFGHEQLDVYRAAIEYVGWAYRLCKDSRVSIGRRKTNSCVLRKRSRLT